MPIKSVLWKHKKTHAIMWYFHLHLHGPLSLKFLLDNVYLNKITNISQNLISFWNLQICSTPSSWEWWQSPRVAASLLYSTSFSLWPRSLLFEKLSPFPSFQFILHGWDRFSFEIRLTWHFEEIIHWAHNDKLCRRSKAERFDPATFSRSKASLME